MLSPECRGNARLLVDGGAADTPLDKLRTCLLYIFQKRIVGLMKTVRPVGGNAIDVSSSILMG